MIEYVVIICLALITRKHYFKYPLKYIFYLLNIIKGIPKNARNFGVYMQLDRMFFNIKNSGLH